jgi:hypothetical protein
MLAMLVWRMSEVGEGQFSDNLEIITYKEQHNTVHSAVRQTFLV